MPTFPKEIFGLYLLNASNRLLAAQNLPHFFHIGRQV